MAEDSIKNLTPASPDDPAPAGEGNNELQNLKTVLQLHWPELDAIINNSGATGAAGDTDPPDAATWSKLFDDVRALTGNVGAIGSVPLGACMVWPGLPGDIPAGWAPCDGNNGQPINGIAIPDYRDRYIMGAGGTYAVNEEFGSEPGTATTEVGGSHSHGTGDHALTPAELPANLGLELKLSDTDQSDNHSRTSSAARGNSDLNSDFATPLSSPQTVGAVHNHGNTDFVAGHTHDIAGLSYPPSIGGLWMIYVGT